MESQSGVEGVDDNAEIDDRALTVEDDLIKRLKRIDRVVKSVVECDEDLFYVRLRGGKPTLGSLRLGKALISVLVVGEYEYSYYFPLHNVSPYADLLFRCVERLEDPFLPYMINNLLAHEIGRAVCFLNELVDDIKSEAHSTKFKKTIRRFDKAARKRSKSLSQYVEALFNKHSRLLVVRVDLSYRSEYFQTEELREKVKQVKNDWSKMQRDLYQGIPVPGMLGFACKLEYGHLKGFHFHLLVFYDGAKYRKDIVLAKLIGKHWAEVITNGRGTYYNCNKNKGKYRRLGIGVINHFDSEKVSNLKGYVSEYLVKVDYWVRLLPECGRVFFRGNMPKMKSLRRGRPRGSFKTTSNI
ncbi:YagK/YfjJ domain-containing protein [Marinobacter sp.]|uniref:YagK/YfjJ domain-containing protein n=1 Tax=Marinobacter sp. TaxID=50741 RepID=UPI003A8FAB5F